MLLNPTPTSSNVTLVKLLYFSINFHFYKMEKVASLADGLFNKYFVPSLGLQCARVDNYLSQKHGTQVSQSASPNKHGTQVSHSVSPNKHGTQVSRSVP